MSQPRSATRDPSVPRSRRRLLLGGGLAAAATGTALVGGRADAAPTPGPLTVTTADGTAITGKVTGREEIAVGVLGTTRNGAGLKGVATGTAGSGVGVRAIGHTGVDALGSGIGVLGTADAQDGFAGVYGAGGEYGCYAYGNRYGVYGSSGGEAGVSGFSNSTTGRGVQGQAYGRDAVGVHGRNDGGGPGVHAASFFGNALWAESRQGYGVLATSTDKAAVFGKGRVGLRGVAGGTASSQGVRGEDASQGASTTTWAGLFKGRTAVFGTLTVSAAASLVDHPLDPTGKTLSHGLVDSPELKTVYDGTVTLGDDGTAVVALPAYAEALGRDFRYQLTCVGGAAGVYVAAEVSGGSFIVAGGRKGLSVCWQVTATRKDAYAQSAPVLGEQAKPAAERGTYLNPAAFGKPPTASGVPTAE